MHSLEAISSFHLILTKQCNLRCSYCYQADKAPRHMGWKTLRAAADLALSLNRRKVKLVFSGGEPLLEFTSIKRTVEYVERHSPPERCVEYGLVTNGLLLTEEMASFLSVRRFDTRLSFDGLPEAQNLRGRNTFAILDHLLDRTRESDPGFYRRNLTVSMTLTPAAIGHLADSFDYFVEKGIQQVSISPVATPFPGWHVDRARELDTQFERVFRRSLRHYQETGETPLVLFRRSKDEKRPPGGRTMCGVGRGELVAIDVDGSAYGCAALAGSFGGLSPERLGRRLCSLGMGDIRDPRFPSRHGSFPEAVRRAEIFHRKEDRYSSYGQCAECRHFALCSICPVSLTYESEDSDPNRVSDFACAFNFSSLRYRELFPAQPGPWDTAANLAQFRRALKTPSSRRSLPESPRPSSGPGRRLSPPVRTVV